MNKLWEWEFEVIGPNEQMKKQMGKIDQGKNLTP